MTSFTSALNVKHTTMTQCNTIQWVFYCWTIRYLYLWVRLCSMFDRVLDDSFKYLRRKVNWRRSHDSFCFVIIQIYIHILHMWQSIYSPSLMKSYQVPLPDWRRNCFSLRILIVKWKLNRELNALTKLKYCQQFVPFWLFSTLTPIRRYRSSQL